MSVLLALALVVVGAPQADKTYFIQYRPALNKAYRYDIETTLKGGTTGSIKIGKTVKAVKFEGRDFTVLTTFDSVQLGIGSSEQMVQAERLVKETVITQVIDSEGRLVSSDGNRGVASLAGGGLDAIDAIAFSPNPVKVGDTWHTSVDSNGTKDEADLTLERVSTDRGRQVAHLRLAPTTAAGAPILVDVDMATGVLMRVEMTRKGANEGGLDPAMHVVIRLR